MEVVESWRTVAVAAAVVTTPNLLIRALTVEVHTPDHTPTEIVQTQTVQMHTPDHTPTEIVQTQTVQAHTPDHTPTEIVQMQTVQTDTARTVGIVVDRSMENLTTT